MVLNWGDSVLGSPVNGSWGILDWGCHSVGVVVVMMMMVVLGDVLLSVETEELLVFIISPVSHGVKSHDMSISVLRVVLLDDRNLFGEEVESELVFLSGSVGFTVFGNEVDEGQFNVLIDCGGGGKTDKSCNSKFHL